MGIKTVIGRFLPLGKTDAGDFVPLRVDDSGFLQVVGGGVVSGTQVNIVDGTNTALKAKVGSDGRLYVEVLNPGLTDAQLRASAIPVSGPLTDAQLRAASVPVSTGLTQPLTDTQLRATPVPVNGTVTVTDGSGPLTVDGSVAVSNMIAAVETGLAKDATLTARLPAALDADGGVKTHVQNFPASQAVTGPLTDAQLRASAVPVDTELTTQDFDSGAGTVQAAVTGLVVPAAGGPAAIPGDVANGLDVDVTRLPSIPTGANVIGALVANQSVNNAQIGGSAIVASVTGVQDVMPRKRSASAGLAPVYDARRITTNTTTTVVASTAYLQCIIVCVSGAGTAWSIKIQNKEATPKIVYSATAAVGTTQPLNSAEPIIMTSGIDIVTAGTVAGTVDIFLMYWQ